LKATHDRKKFYAYKNMVCKEFKVRELVFLRVRSKKSSLMLGSYVKLAARYYGHFEIMDRIGLVASRVALRTNTRAYNVFRVSLLKKYAHINSNQVID